MKRQRNVILFLVGIFLLLAATLSFAQESELSLFADIPIVVTSASGRAQKLHDVSQSMYVISKEDIVRSGAKDFGELLYRVPGMQVHFSNLSSYEIGIRGKADFLTRDLLVLVDGVVVFNQLYNGTYWDALPVTLNEVERIEIIRGPGGVLYTSNAVSGVINIITKSAKVQEKYVAVKGGTQQYKEAGLAIAGKSITGKTAARVAYQFDDQVGFQKVNGVGDNVSFLRGHRVGVRMQHEFSGGTNLDVIVRDGRISQKGIAVFGGTITRDRATSFLATKITHEINENYDISIHLDHAIKAASIYTTNDFDVHSSSAMMQHNIKYSLFGDHLASVGGEWRRNLANVADNLSRVPEQTQTIVSYFFQDEYRPADKWIFTAGSRVDKNSVFGTVTPAIDQWLWSPRFSAIYKVTDRQSFRASATRSYGAPTLLGKDIYAVYVPSINLYIVGDVNLEPERIWTYELGYRGLFVEGKFDIDAAVFYSQMHDCGGVNNMVNLPPLAVVYDNNGDLNTLGFEINGSYKVNDAVKVISDYTYTMPTYKYDHYATSLQDGAYKVAKHQVGAGVQYVKGKVSVDLYVKCVGGYATGNSPITGASGDKIYQVWKESLRLGYKVKIGGNDGEVELIANNFAGAHVYETTNKYEREPQVYMGLKVWF